RGDVSTGAGPRGADPQARRGGATIGHPDLSFILHLFPKGLGIERRRSKPSVGTLLVPQTDRRDHERRAGLRKRAMFSGVSRIHQGPCGPDWIPSRLPDWHQAAMVETFTLSRSAAILAEQRPSARYPCADATGPSGQPLGME